MKNKILFIFLVTAIISCGGGGGGSGESNGPAPTGIRVLHASVDGSPIDLYTSLEPGSLVADGYFAANTQYGALPQGQQVISFTLHNTSSVLLGSSALTVEKSKHYSLLYYGNNGNLGLKASIISDDAGEIPDGKAAIKIVHGLVGAAVLNTKFSDGQSVEDITFGTASSYVNVEPGLGNITIKRASDGLTVASLNTDLAPGKSYTVMMAGEIDYFVTSRLLED